MSSIQSLKRQVSTSRIIDKYPKLNEANEKHINDAKRQSNEIKNNKSIHQYSPHTPPGTPPSRRRPQLNNTVKKVRNGGKTHRKTHRKTQRKRR